MPWASAFNSKSLNLAIRCCLFHHRCRRRVFFAALLRRDLYVALFAPGSAACFANEFSATETLVTLDGHDAAAIANIAFQHTLLSGQFPSALTFVTFGRDRTGALAFAATNFARTITSGAYQNEKPHSDLSGQ